MTITWDLLNFFTTFEPKVISIVTEKETLIFPTNSFTIAFREDIIVVKEKGKNKIFLIPVPKIVYIVFTYGEKDEKEGKEEVLKEMGIETI